MSVGHPATYSIKCAWLRADCITIDILMYMIFKRATAAKYFVWLIEASDVYFICCRYNAIMDPRRGGATAALLEEPRGLKLSDDDILQLQVGKQTSLH